jgi:hypothetical protein
MKSLVLAGVVLATLARPSSTRPLDVAQSKPPTRNVGTMSELMVKIIYPTSDALFYIESRTPKTDAEWGALEGQALMLAESANLLMMPGRARDQNDWMKYSRLMLDAAADALAAAKKKDIDGITLVGERLLESCTACHKGYRKDYGKPRGD